MASVFLSYDREDAARARVIAGGLEKAGHSVWWDQHIRGGAQYSKEIDKALKAADAVVVLWSVRSVESAWVRDEAAAGRDSGRLVPVRLDSTDPPLGFRQYQAIDLSKRKGRGQSAQLESLIEAVETITPVAAEVTSVAAIRQEPVSRDRRLPLLALAALIVVAGAALFFWQPWAGKADGTVVAVSALADDAASKALARDLLVKLGDIQTPQSRSIQLVSGDDRSAPTPEFLLQASRVADAGASGASLVLMGANDRKVLWSKDFQQPYGRYSDLAQQVAFSAGRVLDCAVEGTSSPGAGLELDELKPYLTACTRLSEAYRARDISAVIPDLREVLDEAPGFKAAWAKLLIAQSIVTSSNAAFGGPDPQARDQLRQSIERARKVDPRMAEASLAEASLLPARDFAGQMRLLDRAVEESPDNPVALNFRAIALQNVGRVNDALADSQRAAELDPLSPTKRIDYIFALASAGRTDTATKELAKAARLWPGTDVLARAQFEFHQWYGDPRQALKMEQVETARGGPRRYLEAKINPTKANIDRLFKFVDDNLARMPNPVGGLSWSLPIFGEFNRNEQLLEKLLNWPSADDLTSMARLYFEPRLRALRHDPRFLLIAKRAGLLDYWKSSGKWPDFCFDGDQPYDCKAKAAKLSEGTG